MDGKGIELYFKNRMLMIVFLATMGILHVQRWFVLCLNFEKGRKVSKIVKSQSKIKENYFIN